MTIFPFLINWTLTPKKLRFNLVAQSTLTLNRQFSNSSEIVFLMNLVCSSTIMHSFWWLGIFLPIAWYNGATILWNAESRIAQNGRWFFVTSSTHLASKKLSEISKHIFFPSHNFFLETPVNFSISDDFFSLKQAYFSLWRAWKWFSILAAEAQVKTILQFSSRHLAVFEASFSSKNFLIFEFFVIYLGDTNY